MLCDLLIEKEKDIFLSTHLRKFIEERGDFAHKGQIKTSITAAAAQNRIDAILIIAEDVVQQSKALINQTT